MCRNIRTLHNFEPPATDEEIQEAALQYVRKVSGYTKPSHVNERVFAEAVGEVAAATGKLLERRGSRSRTRSGSIRNRGVTSVRPLPASPACRAGTARTDPGRSARPRRARSSPPA